MKGMRLCIFLFLLPSLLIALGEKECIKLHEHAVLACKEGKALLDKLLKLGPEECEQRLTVLDQALVCYEKAKQGNDTVLVDISHKKSEQRDKHWRVLIKDDCKRDNGAIVSTIERIKKERDNALIGIAYKRADVCYQESEKKEALALSKIQSFPPRHLDNADAVASALNEAAGLYEEAEVNAQNALSLFHTIPSSSEASKASLKQAVDQYRENARFYRKEAAEWPATIRAQHAAIQEVEKLYQESEKKAALAAEKIQTCPPRRMNTVEAVTATLNEAALLYEEASTHVKQAFSSLMSAPFSQEEDKKNLLGSAETYQVLGRTFRQKAAEWPNLVSAHKRALKERLAALKEERELFEGKKLNWAVYEVQKEMILLLEELIEGPANEEEERFKEELALLNVALRDFETDADRGRLTNLRTPEPPVEFREREKERRECFFKHFDPRHSFSTLMQGDVRPSVMPLDGQRAATQKRFTLYADQFYRFSVQSDEPLTDLVVKVYEEGKILLEESIALPVKLSPAWESYLKEGMVFIPQTKLKTAFGIDLRIQRSEE